MEKEAEEEKIRELERKAQEEKERKEQEEYLKLKEAFSVESEGFDETEGSSEENSLMAFINYIKVRANFLLCLFHSLIFV